jgi:HEPN domain-containing protein
MTRAELEYERDPEHWLKRLLPDEWIRAALRELGRAQAAFAAHNSSAALASVKRAAGMALNGALIVRPIEAWGRTYAEHLKALSDDALAPAPVREAARRLDSARPPTGQLVVLRTKSDQEQLLDAAQTVMAHAYAIVHGSTGRGAGA